MLKIKAHSGLLGKPLNHVLTMRLMAAQTHADVPNVLAPEGDFFGKGKEDKRLSAFPLLILFQLCIFNLIYYVHNISKYFVR
jgi:hypothetical protein